MTVLETVQRRGLVTQVALLLLTAILSTPARAQVPLLQPERPAARLETGSGTFDRESVAAARADIEAALSSGDADADGEMRSLLGQLVDELDRAERLLDERDEPETLPDLDPPFSLRDLDRTIERQQAVAGRRKTLEEAVRSAEAALERVTRVLDDTRRKVADGTADRNAVRLADGRVRLARFQLRNTRLELATSEDLTERLARAVEEKRRRLQVDQDDLDVRVNELREKQDELTAARKRLLADVEEARQAWRAAVDGKLPDEQTGALRATLAALERRLAVNDMMRSDLAMAIEAWTLRYRLAAGDLADQTDEASAKRRLAAQLSDLVHGRDLAQAERERLRAEMQRLESARDRADDDETRRWLDLSMGALTERLDMERDYLASLQGHIVDHQRYLDAFAADGVAENVQEGVTAIRDTIASAWNFEVTTVDDRTITVGKIAIALLLILAGTLLSRSIARQMRRRVFDRLSMDASLAASLQTLTLYVLVLLFFLTALRFVSIPLTALTFIGGALAIGIGFGSQNIVNNFISGLILMAERPIKVGDMIEVGGTFGRVERIGGRSTRVRSGNNTHIIVPNSTFLEKEVLNWTLSDATIRTEVDVGVEYGSPTREVTKLLLRAVEGHGKILKRPGPEVLFMNFGDNSLEFRIYFWIQVRRILDRLVIQSDVRYRIDQHFREAGIVIAFPQRDVHFDTGRPLEIRMLSDGDTPAAGAPERKSRDR